MDIFRLLKLKNKYLFEIIKKNYVNYKYGEYLVYTKLKKINIDICYIEFTSSCNLKCKFCSLDNSRAKGYMKQEILKKILENITNSNISVNELSLHLAGETLLHPKIATFLRMIAKYKEQNVKFPKVTLLTNAIPLNDKLSRQILESDALDEIRFSIDGGNKENYEEIRIGASWEKVINNVNKFLDLNKSLNKNIRTRIFTIIKKNTKFSPEFINLKNRVNQQIIRPLHNWTGDVNLGIESTTKSGLCHFILKDIAILWDGRVTTCCANLNGTGIIGDIKNETIEEIWYGKPHIDMIKMMKDNKRGKIKSCSMCGL